MISLNEQEREAVAQRLDFASKYYHPGEDSVSFLSNVYCEFLPNTAPQQGRLMAEHVLKRIRELDETRAAFAGTSQEELRRTLRTQLLDQLQKRPLQEQCRTLHAIREGMGRLEEAMRQEPAAMEQYFQKTANSRASFYMGKITESARDKLLEDVLEKILCTEGADAAFARVRKERAASPGLESLLDSDTCRGLYTIVLYTLLLDGDSRLPKDMAVSIDHVLLEVCREYGVRQILRELEVQRFSLQEASGACRALWTAVKAILTISVIAGGIAIMFLCPDPLVIFLSLMATVMLGYAIPVMGDEVLEKTVTETRKARLTDQLTRELQAEAGAALSSAVPLFAEEEKKTEQPDTNIW